MCISAVWNFRTSALTTEDRLCDFESHFFITKFQRNVHIEIHFTSQTVREAVIVTGRTVEKLVFSLCFFHINFEQIFRPFHVIYSQRDITFLTAFLEFLEIFFNFGFGNLVEIE